jgi:Phytanoyl-CoA dioxygenase (PhyH)
MPAPRTLSAEEIETYRRDGLVVPRFCLDPCTLVRLRGGLDELIRRNPGVRPEQLISVHVAKGGGERVVGSEIFLDVARDPRILDRVADLIGDDLILWGCHLFCKPPGDGMAIPWHQDGRYWPIRPLATCTVWVALDWSVPENGCMRFIPGSHSGKVYAHRRDSRPDLALDLVLEEGEVDRGAARDVVLEPGQMSLHDVYLVHGSAPNRSPRRRAGLALRYMPATSLFDRGIGGTSTTSRGLVVDFSKRPLWLVRGEDRAGNDFSIGHG